MATNGKLNGIRNGTHNSAHDAKLEYHSANEAIVLEPEQYDKCSGPGVS